MTNPVKLQFTEDHELLRKTARRLLLERCSMSEIRAFAERSDPMHQALFKDIAGTGWLGMLIPEEFGGAGLDHRSLAVVLEEAGRRLVPAPILSTVLAGACITACGSDEQKQRYLPALATGDRVGAIAFTEPGGSWEPDAVASKAIARDSGFILSGVKNHVLWAECADFIIVPARVDDTGDLGVFVVDPGTAGVRVERERGVDPTRPMARVSLDGVKLHREARLAAGSMAAWRSLHVRGYCLLSAEMIGAAQAVLLTTRDYANERVQFNRPIGSFQAVKHPLVDVLVALESARSLCAGAVAALDSQPDEAENLARMAKSSASDALAFAVDRGVQLHGGFGFTWDCDIHFYFKRSLWSAATLGDGLHHRRHLAGQLLD